MNPKLREVLERAKRASIAWVDATKGNPPIGVRRENSTTIPPPPPDDPGPGDGDEPWPDDVLSNVVSLASYRR